MAFDNTRARMTPARALHPARLLAFTCLVLTMGLTACSNAPIKPPTGTPEPDKFLFERGTEQLNRKHWLTSREYFRQLVDSYPQSRYRAEAKLGIGDTYVGEHSAESFVLAANEFREFMTFYPTHERAAYAQFKLGMTHFYQMHSAERDQTETRDAIKELTVFVERYPKDKLIDEGRARLREARDRLSQSEYRVGYFYWRSRWYPGAVDRFKSILAADPQYSSRDALYFYLADALVKLQKHQTIDGAQSGACKGGARVRRALTERRPIRAARPDARDCSRPPRRCSGLRVARLRRSGPRASACRSGRG
jgi:outer membrane protein assembly factor BamD